MLSWSSIALDLVTRKLRTAENHKHKILACSHLPDCVITNYDEDFSHYNYLLSCCDCSSTTSAVYYYYYCCPYTCEHFYYQYQAMTKMTRYFSTTTTLHCFHCHPSLCRNGFFT